MPQGQVVRACHISGGQDTVDTENKLVLVLGGARSGKSEFAENFVLHAGAVCSYIATAEILDAEMAERVKLHQARRKNRWITFEAPYHAEDVFPEAGERTDAILFDDITLYLSNLLYGQGAPAGTAAPSFIWMSGPQVATPQVSDPSGSAPTRAL